MLLRVPLLSAVLLFALGAAATPTPGNACSCHGPLEVEDEVKRADAVFRGVAQSRSNESTLYYFEVSEVWKGRVNRRAEVWGAIDICGYGYDVGVEYLVYASYAGDNQLESSVCTRTSPIEYAGEDLAILGSGYQPGSMSYPNGGSGGLADPVAGPDRLKALLVVGLTTMLILGLIGARLLNQRHANRPAPSTVDRT